MASTVGARLKAAGRSYRVSPRTRKLKIPVRGKKSVRLKLTLQAGKLKTRQTVVIPRR